MPRSFVSRASSRNNTRHVILGTAFHKPAEFAVHSINLNMGNAWGIVKVLCDRLLKLDEGKYLIAKDPNRASMRIYRVPENAFTDRADEQVVEEEK